MAGGYMGQFLLIDLTRGRAEPLAVETELREQFIGGKGFGAKLLFDLVPGRADPLGENNVLMFLPGPLTGTLAPAMRGCVVSKSPLTGTFVDSYFGGSFAQEIKYAGYDGLIFKGKAAEPVYVLIEDHRVSIRPAGHLWGKDTFATTHTIKAEAGETARVACIGPAGEKLVRFALINCEYNRHAGRGGCGAVMGAKNLKAIAIIGTRGVTVHDPLAFKEAVNRAREELQKSVAIEAFTVDGTPGSIPFADEEGLLPAFNYREGSFSGATALDAATQRRRLWLRQAACLSCPIACGKIGVIRRGGYTGTITDVVEYETAAMLGANLGIANTEAVAYLARRCDALGLDGMSAGGVIGFVMEAAGRGQLDASQFNEELPAFGDAKGAIRLLEEIAWRQTPLGNLLAEGVRRAAAALGPAAEAYAVHVKGLETPAWGPRGAPGMALAYLTGDRGGCHQRAFPILYEVGGESWQGQKVERLGLEGKAALVIWLQNYLAGLDTLVKCDFAQYGISGTTYAYLLSAATGCTYTEADLYLVGERIWNLTRLFNYREGFRRADDRLPRRFLEEPLPNGPAAGHHLRPADCEAMLDDYYALRGWDATGQPTAATLARLNLQAP
ncbi:aldehyde ferredoxin oxidoreductase family protein [Moorella naiadis]|uniref:aldehyde ferredoxin oxidoreductase family protein n=1 Tax=Moorella naiadis (nom. illeg.) TaxID=3093670 RepID=UPI003D9CB943